MARPARSQRRAGPGRARRGRSHAPRRWRRRASSTRPCATAAAVARGTDPQRPTAWRLKGALALLQVPRPRRRPRAAPAPSRWSPEDAVSWTNLGDRPAASGAAADAEASLGRALALQPDLAPARYNLRRAAPARRRRLDGGRGRSAPGACSSSRRAMPGPGSSSAASSASTARSRPRSTPSPARRRARSRRSRSWALRARAAAASRRPLIGRLRAAHAREPGAAGRRAGARRLPAGDRRLSTRRSRSIAPTLRARPRRLYGAVVRQPRPRRQGPPVAAPGRAAPRAARGRRPDAPP